MKRFKVHKIKKQEVKKTSLTRTQKVMVERMTEELKEQGENSSEVITKIIMEKAEERKIEMNADDVLDVVSALL